MEMEVALCQRLRRLTLISGAVCMFWGCLVGLLADSPMTKNYKVVSCNVIQNGSHTCHCVCVRLLKYCAVFLMLLTRVVLLIFLSVYNILLCIFIYLPIYPNYDRRFSGRTMSFVMHPKCC
jgi:hypothetical protein